MAFIAFLAVKILMRINDFLQHPQIQKKSQYIKYLCCDDVRTLHQWINGIRIAKVTSSRQSCTVLMSCHYLFETTWSYLVGYMLNLTSLYLPVLNVNCTIFLHVSFSSKIAELSCCYNNSAIRPFLFLLHLHHLTEF